VVSLRPNWKDAELERFRLICVRAVHKLYEHGLTVNEISDALGITLTQVPPQPINPMIEEDVFTAWGIVLDRFFGKISDQGMLDQLLSITFHTHNPPPQFWYESSPDGSGKVLMRFYQEGYISKEEYQRILEQGTFQLVPQLAE
jgi:hypothetical protein